MLFPFHFFFNSKVHSIVHSTIPVKQLQTPVWNSWHWAWWIWNWRGMQPHNYRSWQKHKPKPGLQSGAGILLVRAWFRKWSESAKLMLVTTLDVDNFDCAKINAHFKTTHMQPTSTHNEGSVGMCILVKAQPSHSKHLTWPWSPNRLSI